MLQFTLLLQLLLASFAFAAPIEAADHGNAWQYGTGGGIIGLIVLILDIIVFSKSNILDSPSPASQGTTALTIIQSRSSSPTARPRQRSFGVWSSSCSLSSAWSFTICSPTVMPTRLVLDTNHLPPKSLPATSVLADKPPS